MFIDSRQIAVDNRCAISLLVKNSGNVLLVLFLDLLIGIDELKPQFPGGHFARDGLSGSHETDEVKVRKLNVCVFCAQEKCDCAL